MIGLGIGIMAGLGSSRSAGPAISSMNFSQGDTAGGGQSVVINGTNLASATVVVDPAGTPTPMTVTGNTSTQITCTLPAKAAGVYTLRVTTSAGHVDTTFEYWAPDTDTSCTLFCLKNYARPVTTGTWTTRHGSVNPAATSGAPAASGGCPVWAGAQALSADTIGNLMKMTGGSAGTFAAVFTPTAAAAHDSSSNANLIENPGLFGDQGRGAISALYDSAGFSLVVLDTDYKISSTPLAADSAIHLGVARFSDGTFVETSVDGSSFTAHQTAIGTYNAGTAQAVVLGENYGTKQLNNVTQEAVAIFNTKVSDATATKIHKWAQQALGTP